MLVNLSKVKNHTFNKIFHLKFQLHLPSQKEIKALI